MGFLSTFPHIGRFKMRSPEVLLAAQAWIMHPLPWRIEHDWTVEVHASDGYIVAKCQSVEEAESVIEYAKGLQETIDSIFDQDGMLIDDPK